MKKLLSMRPKSLAHGAGLILKIGLVLIAAELIYITVSLSHFNGYDIARLGLYIYSMIEHVVMSLVLIVGGALLFDIALKEKEGKENHD